MKFTPPEIAHAPVECQKSEADAGKPTASLMQQSWDNYIRNQVKHEKMAQEIQNTG